VSPDSRRLLGIGLLAGAGGITALMLVWLATSGAMAGGIVLGLMLLLVLAGPLAGAGWYVLASGRADQAAEEAFASKRRILEADRLFRAELSARLNQLAENPGMPGDDLRRLAAELNRTVQDESAWYDAVHLDDRQIEVLQRYDDLVWEQVRWLGDHRSNDSESLRAATDELRRAIEQRTDLLVRGQAAMAVSPRARLQASQGRSDRLAFERLTQGDAISRDGLDYVVDSLAVGFAEGATWKLAHLAPSGGGAAEQWLSISPDALELAWLDAVAPPAQAGTPQLSLGAETMTLADQRSLVVQVFTSERGEGMRGVLVRTWRYRSATHLGVVEQWPDGDLVAYLGHVVTPTELELWPASRRAVSR
jgi:hypothetical protein